MDIIACDHCGTRVIPKADGSCPSCRKAVRAGTGPGSPAPEFEIKDARGWLESADSGPNHPVTQTSNDRHSPESSLDLPEDSTFQRFTPSDRSEISRMQREVKSLLTRGVVYSILWLAGFGSIYSIYCASKARRLITASHGEVRGMGRVRWCFIVGGFGVLLLLMVLVAMVWDSVRQ